MKNYFKIFGILTLGLVLTLSSCKDDDDKTPAKTPREYLIAGYWKTTAQVIDPGVNLGGTVITDFFTLTPDCTKDDLVRFNADGTITEDEGPTKCDDDDPQTVTEGTWVLSADNTYITINDPDEGPMIFQILELNDNTFKGNYTFVTDFGTGLQTYTVTVTMIRQ